MLGIIVSTLISVMMCFTRFSLSLSTNTFLGKRITSVTPMNVAREMKIVFIRYRYRAPRAKSQLPVPIPNPTVQSGGIKAVAMATPGMTLPMRWLRLLRATIPASPPHSAMPTSYMVGEVRASSSDWTSSSGVTRKYMVAVATLNSVATR